MAYLMANYPDMDMGTSMVLSTVSAGITTSILLETTLLHLGKDRLPWGAAAKTAMGMSLVSMIAMEFTENLVTLGLSDSTTTITSPNFWAITGLSMAAGFVAPLPYNYIRLKLWGKSCH
ncbi:uncharacterized protein CcaverHIS019_0705700 [Cutaneotrichosporon cavernicola]|uniref:DUF4396 domain-containing protein n=1 Tax=Cutaneotrichosporon cavernicola TaxID=279322 RepID=A0AA48LAL8_9TREE|nr:uncharacterized protein CcaverHIS019_0705700 [Cutaneotrichosporon cavernicola]BEI94989.1 hypothetical protein CcaverHIS019_0705700 [Cutaneotrichosporon cavernicola]BEJ10516.1 hypothetical protein CcaverHIS641_0705510 [Cutaneotrichosporon cavernicola]